MFGCRYHLGTDAHLPGRHVRTYEAILEPVVMGSRRTRRIPWSQAHRFRRLPLRFLVRHRDTCALDVADRGPHSTNAIAEKSALWHTNTEHTLEISLAKLTADPTMREWAQRMGIIT